MGIQTEGLEILVAAGVVLCRHENQTRASFRGTTLLHRGSAAGLQDTDDRSVRGDNANSDGEYYCKSENQRHEERNHGRPPLVLSSKNLVTNRNIQMPPAQLSSTRLLQSTCVKARR
jgi:hypothetical protein